MGFGKKDSNSRNESAPEDVIVDAIKPADDEPKVVTHGYGEQKTVTKGDAVIYNGIACHVTLVHPEGYVDLQEVEGAQRWFGRIAVEGLELAK